MNRHAFVNSNPSGFDSDCSVCGGKDRDWIHGEHRDSIPEDYKAHWRERQVPSGICEQDFHVAGSLLYQMVNSGRSEFDISPPGGHHGGIVVTADEIRRIAALLIQLSRKVKP